MAAPSDAFPCTLGEVKSERVVFGADVGGREMTAVWMAWTESVSKCKAVASIRSVPFDAGGAATMIGLGRGAGRRKSATVRSASMEVGAVVWREEAKRCMV